MSSSPLSPSKSVFGAVLAHSAPPEPVSRLPVELLSDIFSLVSGPSTTRTNKLNQTMQSQPHTQFHNSASPLNLTHVSQSWRNVAVGTPLLWSTLLLHGALPYHPDLLRLWLQRSGTCPLTISFYTWRYCLDLYDTTGWGSNPTGMRGFDDSPELDGPCQCNFACPKHDDARVDTLLDVLVGHAERWKEVRFNFAMHVPTPLLRLKVGQLSSLVAASFNHNNLLMDHMKESEMDCILSHERTFWDALQATPSLRVLSLTGPLPNFSSWSLLRELRLYQTPDLSFLSECTSLRALSLIGVSLAADSQIHLPNLDYLSMSEDPDGFCIDSLTIPSLKTLEYTPFDLSPALSSLQKCLTQSSAHLENLKLSCHWHDTWVTEDVVRTLTGLFEEPALSEVTTLTLTECALPQSLVTALARREPSLMMPQLRTISLGCAIEIEDKSLVELAENRCRRDDGLGTLGHLEIVFHPSFSGDRYLDNREITALLAMQSTNFRVTTIPYDADRRQ